MTGNPTGRVLSRKQGEAWVEAWIADGGDRVVSTPKRWLFRSKAPDLPTVTHLEMEAAWEQSWALVLELETVPALATEKVLCR